MPRTGGPSKPVRELEPGDVTIDYGPVTHREGRKVWFEAAIVTFTTESELVTVTPDSIADDGFSWGPGSR